ncbi:MAG: VIT1/CCC1 family protein [Anaerolineae bacterium]|nr:VIT1/CCC1 family protein [Thermoflexales bacterium]MDW8407349.1 VIT1/CCC1 family protein [Anaerolineae bacterium]
MDQQTIKRYLDFLSDELNGAALYNALAEAERDEHLATVYRRMAAVEQRHAEVWINKLTQAGVAIPPFKPSLRTRVFSMLARRFGVALVLPTITELEQKDSGKYGREAGAGDLSVDESSHARVLTAITQPVRGKISGSAIAQLEGRHRAGGGNALRAAVLGANDGLVSNLSLVMGVAGAADLNEQAILIAGLAGLLAGAISMALGEWLSVQSSRELYQRQIAIERAEIANAPDEEVEELTLIYQARGIDEARARQMAQQIIREPASAVEALAREELGVDPEELGGSAWEAAITSFLLFAVGAIFPVSAFFFLQGMTAVLVSILVSAVGLFIIGSAITLFTGRSVWFSGSRQVLFGLAAAAITFTIGRLVGVNLGG